MGKYMTKSLHDKIEIASVNPSDINEHIYTLLKYSKDCHHITEMGVRGICSTWAFLGGLPEKLVSYDIQHPSKWGGDLNEVYNIAREYGVNYNFIQENVLDVDIEQTDLLFIDTWHAYNQLSQELLKHSPKVNLYIIMHDTTSFEFVDENPYTEEEQKTDNKGLWPAIEEFILNHPEWDIHERYFNNNGLTVLKRR